MPMIVEVMDEVKGVIYSWSNSPIRIILKSVKNPGGTYYCSNTVVLIGKHQLIHRDERGHILIQW
jgi:hypothetical protein